MGLYVFVREGCFYPIECEDDEAAREQAEMNPGTLRVEAMDGGPRTVWIAPKPDELAPQ